MSPPHLSAQDSLVLDVGDWEPFTSSRDGNSQVLEELFEEIFALYGIGVEYVCHPWVRSLTNGEDGISDGSFPLIRTPERDLYTISSGESILVEPNVFFHRTDMDFDWEDFSDLRGYRIGATIGYAYMDPLREYGIDLDYVPEEILNFKKLMAGRIDLYPASLHVGIYLINLLSREGETVPLTWHPRTLYEQDYYLLFSRKNPRARELAEMFDEGLRGLRENGRYERIMGQITLQE